MLESEIPDLNIFMMCTQPEQRAFRDLPPGYFIRSCTPADLPLWRAFPFDTETPSPELDAFMRNFFEDVYGGQEALFFANTLWVCNAQGAPVATCASWKAYGKINTIHWFKTLKHEEGKGIGRALLTAVMKRFSPEDYPIYLHTQPGSYRAVKVYSDFGFHLLSGEVKIGHRTNDLAACLPILQRFIPEKYFRSIKQTPAPAALVELLKDETTVEF